MQEAFPATISVAPTVNREVLEGAVREICEQEGYKYHVGPKTFVVDGIDTWCSVTFQLKEEVIDLRATQRRCGLVAFVQSLAWLLESEVNWAS